MVNYLCVVCNCFPGHYAESERKLLHLTILFDESVDREQLALPFLWVAENHIKQKNCVARASQYNYMNLIVLFRKTKIYGKDR